MKCPLCERENLLVQHPDKPGRLVMYCSCHPQGAVLETDALKPERKIADDRTNRKDA